MNMDKDTEILSKRRVKFEGASHVFATLKRLELEESLRSF